MVKWGMMAAKHSEIVSMWGIVEDGVCYTNANGSRNVWAF